MGFWHFLAVWFLVVFVVTRYSSECWVHEFVLISELPHSFSTTWCDVVEGKLRNTWVSKHARRSGDVHGRAVIHCLPSDASEGRLEWLEWWTIATLKMCVSYLLPQLMLCNHRSQIPVTYKDKLYQRKPGSWLVLQMESCSSVAYLQLDADSGLASEWGRPTDLLSVMALAIESEWKGVPSFKVLSSHSSNQAKAPHKPRLTVEQNRLDSAFRQCLDSHVTKAMETGQHE